MKILKRLFIAIILIFTLCSLFTSCTAVPEDDIQANLITIKKTYKRDTNETEIFFLYDLLNGKERSVEKIEIDVIVTFTDNSTQNYTIEYTEYIDYSRSSPLTFTFIVDGRAEEINILEYRFILADYWQTFGGFIISVLITSIIVAVVLYLLAMAEMYNMVSVGSACVVLVCIFFLIFAPFAQSLYVIIGTVIALAPYIYFKITDN